MIRPIAQHSTVTAFAIATIFLSTTLVAQDAQTSTWKGTLNTGGAKLRLAIDIVQDGSQSTGELTSLDQGNAKVKASKIKLTEKQLSFSIKKIGAKFDGKMSKNGSCAKGTFSQGGGNFPMTFTKVDGETNEVAEVKEELQAAWVGKLRMGTMEPIVQFRVMKVDSGETTVYFDSISEGALGFPANHTSDDKSIQFTVPSINLKYEGTLNKGGDVAEGTWHQGGHETPLTLRKQTTEYASEYVRENRPQRPVGPFPYDAEEVKFKNAIDNVTLAGTLTIPKSPGRHPVAILISGSGPQDRDESLLGHKPFLVLADNLTRRGIAVLRYDDRGTSDSTGNFGTATTEDFARDASAAVEFLKSHNRINASEIGLAGHSEGGLIAPMVVGLRDDVAFVVLLAATGVDGAQIITSQTEAMTRATGVDETELAMAMKVNRAVVGVVANAEPAADFTGEVMKAVEVLIEENPESDREEAGKKIRTRVENRMNGLKTPWMRFFIKYDPRPALSKIKCPVFAIVGSKDLQVLPNLNNPEIEKALTKSGNQDFEIVVMDGLNHLFQKCDTGAVEEYLTIQETFNENAMSRIGDWIIQHTSPVK